MKISAIVPVYNSEKTVIRCITSIKSQSYKDFEVILVNDGSTDNSLNILKEWIKDDSRFSLIDQNNKGVSEARNSGLKLVTGKFITFIDSDDEILVDYFTDLIADYLSHPSIDLVWQGMIKVFNNGVCNVSKQKVNCFKANDYLGLFRDAGITLKGNPVAKLFRTDIIFKQNLKFIPSLSYNEDKIFVLEYIYSCKGYILLSNISNYKYYIHTGSLSHSLLMPDEYWKPYKYFKHLIHDKFQIDYQKTDYNILYENFKIYLHMYVNSVFFHQNGNEKEYINRLNEEDWSIYKIISKTKSSAYRKAFDFFLINNQLIILRFFSKIYLKRKFK
jgi:glycosyltransferase involved in cell wall biosynthesis